MTTDKLYIFGEVLFDCFPTGEEVLGGAPFNVACHLHALGDNPVFISRVGADKYGETILQAMRKVRMITDWLQHDVVHPTGQVEVTLHNGDPRYNIVKDSAYDFISSELLPVQHGDGILYHGTLGLRNGVARQALETMSGNGELKIFLDVNLREPWYQKEEVQRWMNNAHWVKMNLEELHILSDSRGDTKQLMTKIQEACGLAQIIVTRGEEGALIRTAEGQFFSSPPPKVEHLVDTVGAGDAFSAVYIHGLRAGWPIDKILVNAQRFAVQVIGIRGATTDEATFYRESIAAFV